jgi:hypothetical protein
MLSRTSLSHLFYNIATILIDVYSASDVGVQSKVSPSVSILALKRLIISLVQVPHSRPQEVTAIHISVLL